MNNNQTFRTSRLFLPALVTGVLALVTPAFGQVINEDIKLLAVDGEADNQFGISIAIDNGIVAVGAWGDDDNGFGSGSAYLFNAATGAQIVKLLPLDGLAGDLFGNSIAIADGVVAVGARWDDLTGSNSGSAYLFNTSGTQTTKLLASDGAAGDEFGFSIAIADGVVAVGAWRNRDNGTNSGSAYLFDAATGVEIFKLLPIDNSTGDSFGWSIDIANGIVAVGAKEDRDNGIRSGSAYLFDAVTGVQIAKLLASDGTANDRFGHSIALGDGVVAVGAWRNRDNGIRSGAAYLFDTSTGVQFAKLLPSDGAGLDEFGWSIAIDNGVVAVGANRHNDNGQTSGSAYLFDAATGVEIAKLLPSDGATLDQFGESIAMDNGVVVVGASLDGDNGFESGSAYVFSVPGADCPADFTGDGNLNFFDIAAFLTAFGNSDPIADFTSDGVFNFFDVAAFLQFFAAGCP
ncbi:MAG: FG-GAP repeat protein [Phycisphaerales bacterium]|nr:FG-GAP repeat protein [Phycisphaerales bacterium]